MLKIYKKYNEIINYVIFGVLTTLVSLVTYYLCSKVFHIYYLVSSVISFIISVLFAYVTNKIYVFKSDAKGSKVLKELFSFVSSRILSFIIENVILVILVSVIKLDDMISKIIVQIIVIILNYILSKLVFLRSKNEKIKSFTDIEFLALNTSLYVYLYGTSRSEACSDRGTVSLEKM